MERRELEESAERLADAGKSALDRGRPKEAARKFRECLALLEEIQEGPETSELWLLDEEVFRSLEELADKLERPGGSSDAQVVPW